MSKGLTVIGAVFYFVGAVAASGVMPEPFSHGLGLTLGLVGLGCEAIAKIVP